MDSNFEDHPLGTIARGDLTEWTPESRAVYLDCAKRLLSEGWELALTSDSNRENAGPYTNDGNYYGYCIDQPGAIFTWATFIHRADMKSFTIWQYGRQAEGGRRAAHGGLVCTAFDHVCGVHLVQALDLPAVTAQISVDCQRPVPLASPVIIEGSIDKVDGRKYYLTLTMKTPDGTKTLSSAKSLWLRDKSNTQSQM